MRGRGIHLLVPIQHRFVVVALDRRLKAQRGNGGGDGLGAAAVIAGLGWTSVRVVRLEREDGGWVVVDF